MNSRSDVAMLTIRPLIPLRFMLFTVTKQILVQRFFFSVLKCVFHMCSMCVPCDFKLESYEQLFFIYGRMYHNLSNMTPLTFLEFLFLMK